MHTITFIFGLFILVEFWFLIFRVTFFTRTFTAFGLIVFWTFRSFGFVVRLVARILVVARSLAQIIFRLIFTRN